MCGRYTLSYPEKLKKRFNSSNNIKAFEPSYNVAPSQTLPVITRRSPNKIEMMRWGFMPSWGKEKNFSFINIRAESTKEKPYFKGVLTNRRCLVPADGFYEWKRVNLEGKEEKFPFFIFLKSRPLFAFAGLYSSIKDAEDKEINTFAIVTCPPNKMMKQIHNRMPVILDKEDEEVWLNSENNDFEKLFQLLDPYPSSKMKSHPVSKRVNSPRNDDEKLLQEVKLAN